MIKSYRVLNRTGFAKAAKKYEKMTRIPAAAYAAKVGRAAFTSDPTLEELVAKVEDAFASAFEGGNRKKALARLRDFGASESHHGVAWRAGMFMGAGVVFTVEGLVASWSDHFRREVPYWPALLQLFGALFLPVIFSLCFYLNSELSFRTLGVRAAAPLTCERCHVGCSFGLATVADQLCKPPSQWYPVCLLNSNQPGWCCRCLSLSSTSGPDWTPISSSSCPRSCSWRGRCAGGQLSQTSGPSRSTRAHTRSCSLS